MGEESSTRTERLAPGTLLEVSYMAVCPNDAETIFLSGNVTTTVADGTDEPIAEWMLYMANDQVGLPPRYLKIELIRHSSVSAPARMPIPRIVRLSCAGTSSM